MTLPLERSRGGSGRTTGQLTVLTSARMQIDMGWLDGWTVQMVAAVSWLSVAAASVGMTRATERLVNELPSRGRDLRASSNAQWTARSNAQPTD